VYPFFSPHATSPPLPLPPLHYTAYPLGAMLFIYRCHLACTTSPSLLLLRCLYSTSFLCKPHATSPPLASVKRDTCHLPGPSHLSPSPTCYRAAPVPTSGAARDVARRTYRRCGGCDGLLPDGRPGGTAGCAGERPALSAGVRLPAPSLRGCCRAAIPINLLPTARRAAPLTTAQRARGGVCEAGRRRRRIPSLPRSNACSSSNRRSAAHLRHLRRGRHSTASSSCDRMPCAYCGCHALRYSAHRLPHAAFHSVWARIFWRGILQRVPSR